MGMPSRRLWTIQHLIPCGRIYGALVALGVDAASINRLKTESIDPDVEAHCRELLKDWKKDEDNIKEKLETLEGMKQCNN